MQEKLSNLPSGLNDCEKCIRGINATLVRLQDPTLALLDAEFRDCFETVLSLSKVCSQSHFHVSR